MNTTPHIYLVGIGGVGMVWIADYALQQGWQVSGSDLTETAEIERLRQAGAVIHIGVNPEAIPEQVTEAVVTSAITASAPHYSEYKALQERKIPIVKRAVWIGRLTRQKYTIAVCGAHGKSTTTAMIGWILDRAGYDPTVFVGGTVTAWKGTRIGQSEYLVLEADEYDRSFHQFDPQLAVVLNIDKDHTDYYTGGLPEIEQSYRRFLRNLPSSVHATPRGPGIVVAYGKDGRVRKVMRGFKYRFRWYDERRLWPGIRVPQPGLHVLLNATAAAHAAHEVGVPHAVIKEALASFPGVGRRFEYLGTWGEAEVYDDYAHHPTEVAATLQAARERWPRGGGVPLTVVYQPHQKARTRELLRELGRCFDGNPPDRLILAPIYTVAGREDGIAVSITDLAQEVSKKQPTGMELQVAQTNEELEGLVRQAIAAPGIVIIMGAGNIRALVEGWR